MATRVVEETRPGVGDGAVRLAPLLADAVTVAGMLGISSRQLQRLRCAGKFGPRPIRLGLRCVRFDVGELREWVAAGCPKLEVWKGKRED